MGVEVAAARGHRAWPGRCAALRIQTLCAYVSQTNTFFQVGSLKAMPQPAIAQARRRFRRRPMSRGRFRASSRRRSPTARSSERARQNRHVVARRSPKPRAYSANPRVGVNFQAPIPEISSGAGEPDERDDQLVTVPQHIATIKMGGTQYEVSALQDGSFELQGNDGTVLKVESLDPKHLKHIFDAKIRKVNIRAPALQKLDTTLLQIEPSAKRRKPLKDQDVEYNLTREEYNNLKQTIEELGLKEQMPFSIDFDTNEDGTYTISGSRSIIRESLPFKRWSRGTPRKRARGDGA